MRHNLRGIFKVVFERGKPSREKEGEGEERSNRDTTNRLIVTVIGARFVGFVDRVILDQTKLRG